MIVDFLCVMIEVIKMKKQKEIELNTLPLVKSIRQQMEWDMTQIIDTWYFEWKERMTDNRMPHRLGFAKEDLKTRISQFINKEIGK